MTTYIYKEADFFKKDQLECIICGSTIECTAWTFDEFPLAYCWGEFSRHFASEEDVEMQNKSVILMRMNGEKMPNYHPMTKMKKYD